MYYEFYIHTYQRARHHIRYSKTSLMLPVRAFDEKHPCEEGLKIHT
jgi:hypothetical protein